MGWVPTYMNQTSVFPALISLFLVFGFLLSPIDCKLSHSSLCIYLTPILAHHNPVDRHSVFKHPNIKRFFKGFLYLYSPVKQPTLAWDLPFFLHELMGKSFEPVNHTSLEDSFLSGHHLS